MNHTLTQIPYALLVGIISFIGYLLAGYLDTYLILPVVVILLILIFIPISKKIRCRSNINNKKRDLF